MVFDSKPRNNDSPAQYSERMFEHLDRSGAIEAQLVRNYIEELVESFPTVDKSDVIGRLKARDDRSHLSAFHELYLARLLQRLRYKPIVHPKLANTSRTPDFLVKGFISIPFIIEATVAFHDSIETERASHREDVVYDALNKMKSPDYWLSIRVQGSPKSSPKASHLRTQLLKWMEKLDWKSLRDSYKNGNVTDLPSYNYDHDGWQLQIRPIPKPLEIRGKPGVRPIGSQFRAFCASTCKSAIRSAILEKANAFDDLRLPYVIALNSYGIHTDVEDVTEVLFGTVRYIVKFDSNDPLVPQRDNDGVWVGQSGPQNRHVSAILVNRRLTPWNVSRSKATIYINPWATNPIRGPLTKLDRVHVRKLKISYRAGKKVNRILRLPIEWPEVVK